MTSERSEFSLDDKSTPQMHFGQTLSKTSTFNALALPLKTTVFIGAFFNLTPQKNFKKIVVLNKVS